MRRASTAATLAVCRFLEASDEVSIHRCHPGYVRFLEASDEASATGEYPFVGVRDGGALKTINASAGTSRCLLKDVREEAMYWQSDIFFRLSSSYRVPRSLGLTARYFASTSGKDRCLFSGDFLRRLSHGPSGFLMASYVVL